MVERFAWLNHYGYNNRLRHSDYRAMLLRTGWTMALEEGEADPKVLRDLPGLRLALPFRDYDPQDLAVLVSVFVARQGGHALH